jgi:hypothetical protein
MLFLLLLAPIAHAADTGSLECKAIYRTTDAQNHTTEKAADMGITFALGGTIKYEADLEGKHFSMMEEKGSSMLAQITTAPDYMKGVVSRAEPDSSGRINLTEVNGYTIYRMECHKLPQANPPRLDLGN